MYGATFLFEVPRSFADPGIESPLLLIFPLFIIVLHKLTLELSSYDGMIPRRICTAPPSAPGPWPECTFQIYLLTLTLTLLFSNKFPMTDTSPANRENPPPPPFVKGGLGGFEDYFLTNIYIFPIKPILQPEDNSL
jgi:hypothetical protein